MMILQHTAFNLIGLGAPLLIAVVSIPLLIAGLGIERFGLLTLIWAVVSYFGLFDLGLGRALTQQLAVVFASNDPGRARPMVATATLLMGGLGVLAGGLMAAAASWGVSLINAVPDRQETAMAVYAMALAMPAIVLTSGFRGILEARGAFGIVNLIRLPLGMFTFLGPLAVVIYAQPRLDWIAWVLAAGRMLGCAAHAHYAWRMLPKDGGAFVVQAELVRPLCVSGGWLTVSNVVSPFMGYVDRFIIGAIVSASAVAYYATPHELATKLWIVPGALTAVLFPAFAEQMARRDERTWMLFKKAIHWLFVALLPVTLTLALFAHDLMSLWINDGFATHSATLLQIFALGILINCLAHVPFTLIQSAGAARVTALVHCGELPFFLAGLWWLTTIYGVLGAAIAWLARIVLDTVLMFALSGSLLERSAKQLFNPWVLGLAAVAGLGFAGAFVSDTLVRTMWLLLTTVITTISVALSRSLELRKLNSQAASIIKS